MIILMNEAKLNILIIKLNLKSSIFMIKSLRKLQTEDNVNFT